MTIRIDNPFGPDYVRGRIDGAHQAMTDRQREEAMEAAAVDDQWRRENGLGPRTTPDDPAYILLHSGHTSTPKVHSDSCYICLDPEFAQMGMSLCRECPNCVRAGRGKGHVPADDTICTACGFDEHEAYLMKMATKQIAVFYEGALEVFR